MMSNKNIYIMTFGDYDKDTGYLLKSKIKVESEIKKNNLQELGYKVYIINGVKQWIVIQENGVVKNEYWEYYFS